MNNIIENVKNEMIKICEENKKKSNFDHWSNHIK